MKMKERIKDWRYTPERAGECTKFVDYINSCAVRNRLLDGPWFEYQDKTFGMILSADGEHNANIVHVAVRYPNSCGTTGDVQKIFDYFGVEFSEDYIVSVEETTTKDDNGVGLPGISRFMGYGIDTYYFNKVDMDMGIDIEFSFIDPNDTSEVKSCNVDAYLYLTYTFYEPDGEDSDFPEHACAAFFMEKIFDYYDSGDSDEDYEEECEDRLTK